MTDANGSFKDLTDSLTDQQLLELRIKAVEMATAIVEKAKMPSRAPYVADNIYAFLLKGTKPEDRQQSTAQEGSKSERRRWWFSFLLGPKKRKL